MGFFDRIRGTKSIPSNATFGISQEGKEKLQEFNGDPRDRILIALETCGTSDIDEISSVSKLSRGQVESLISNLVQKGYVRRVSAESAEEEV